MKMTVMHFRYIDNKPKMNFGHDEPLAEDGSIRSSSFYFFIFVAFIVVSLVVLPISFLFCGNTTNANLQKGYESGYYKIMNDYSI